MAYVETSQTNYYLRVHTNILVGNISQEDHSQQFCSERMQLFVTQFQRLRSAVSLLFSRRILLPFLLGGRQMSLSKCLIFVLVFNFNPILHPVYNSWLNANVV